jgi:hypothetical protein
MQLLLNSAQKNETQKTSRASTPTVPADAKREQKKGIPALGNFL